MPPVGEPKKKRARHDWTLADKIWLLEFRCNNSNLTAAELGTELSMHVNELRTRNQARKVIPDRQEANFHSVVRTVEHLCSVCMCVSVVIA